MEPSEAVAQGDDDDRVEATTILRSFELKIVAVPNE